MDTADLEGHPSQKVSLKRAREDSTKEVKAETKDKVEEKAHYKNDFASLDRFQVAQRGAAIMHPVCLHDLGVCYQDGIGTPSDPVEAFINYNAAMKAGCIGSSYNIARCYEKGIGTVRNPLKAFQHYQVALKENIYYACHKLGLCYVHGIGTSVNHKLAFEQFSLGYKKRKDAICTFYLMLCYLHGVGTDKNKEMVDTLSNVDIWGEELQNHLEDENISPQEMMKKWI